MKYWQAVNRALGEEMERDDRVIVMGQNVAESGGTFGSTRGLLARFGPDRVLDSPISEQATVGAAVGAAMFGLRPVVEIVFSDFLLIAADAVVNQAAKMRYLSAGAHTVPLVIKTGVGVGMGLGAQHSQSLEAWYAHIPGLKVLWPACPEDALGLLKAAIRDPDPVVFLESLAAYPTAGEVSLTSPEEIVPIGQAQIVRAGSDVTLITLGSALPATLAAADALAREGRSAEVIDLRTICPWDVDTVVRSVDRTTRAVVIHDATRDFGVGGEIASTITERCFNSLSAPVLRFGGASVPAPHVRSFERLIRPTGEAIAAGASDLMRQTGRT